MTTKFSIAEIRNTAARQQGKPVGEVAIKAANVNAMHRMAKAAVTCSACDQVVATTLTLHQMLTCN